MGPFIKEFFSYSFVSLSWLCFIIKWHGASAHLNMTSYRQMPPLYSFDDYDACLEVPFEGGNHSVGPTYCMVFAEIAPNATSSLWKQISDFSSDSKRHYRHDYLFFGVCVERCRTLLNQLNTSLRTDLYGGRTKSEDLIEYFTEVHKRDTDDRTRYDREINSCLNYKFRNKYHLKLRTYIEYCEVPNKPLEYDLLDYIFNAIILLFAILNIVSTVYDYSLKKKQPPAMQNNTFYTINPRGRVEYLLTSFSICRNYYRITKPQTSKTAKDLSFLNSFRVLTNLLVILGHVFVLSMSLPIQNPEFIEKNYYRPEMTIVLNGHVIVQTFFVISGFLLNVSWQEKQLFRQNTSFSDCLLVYIKMVAFRYLRLIPSVCVLLLFSATVLVRLDDGPFWRHLTEPERAFCREYWWKNVLFANNFLMEKSCAHHTWYLAADIQLFALFTLLLLIVKIYPKLRRILTVFLVICACVIPALITYFLKLDAIFHFAPESYRYLLFKVSETFCQSYVPFYTNIGGYIFGIMAAEFYIASKINNSLDKYRGVLKYELLFWLCFPLGVAILFTGTIFMSDDTMLPSVGTSFYAGLYRICWIIACTYVLLGVCFRLGWIVTEFCRMPIFRPLATLSYQSYIWHVTVIHVLGAFYRQPVYFDNLSLSFNFVLAFTITNIVAFFVAIFIEHPITAAVTCLNLSNPKVYNANQDKETTNLQNTCAR